MEYTKYEPREDELFHSYKDKDGAPKELVMVEELSAKLLVDGIVMAMPQRLGFTGDDGEPEVSICLFVNCGDTFAYACADAESVNEEDLKILYHTRNEPYSVTKWVCKKRGERPLPVIQKHMKDKGVWDADMEALSPHYLEK